MSRQNSNQPGWLHTVLEGSHHSHPLMRFSLKATWRERNSIRILTHRRLFTPCILCSLVVNVERRAAFLSIRAWYHPQAKSWNTRDMRHRTVQTWFFSPVTSIVESERHTHARHEQRRIQKCDNWKLCKCWKTRCILEHSRLISPTAGEVAKHLSYLCVAELFKHGFCFSPATSIFESERHTHARTRTPWAKTNSKMRQLKTL